MKCLMIGVMMATLAAPALAQNYGSKYDPYSGNMYNWNRYGGNTNINGYNTSTGSTWNTTVKPNGNMNGYDSSGNHWNYNANTKTYMNSNGKVCVGEGYARTCN